MTAGYDTTAVALSWFAYEMSLHPDIQERLAKEIDEQVGQVRLFRYYISPFIYVSQKSCPYVFQTLCLFYGQIQNVASETSRGVVKLDGLVTMVTAKGQGLDVVPGFSIFDKSFFFLVMIRILSMHC